MILLCISPKHTKKSQFHWTQIHKKNIPKKSVRQQGWKKQRRRILGEGVGWEWKEKGRQWIGVGRGRREGHIWGRGRRRRALMAREEDNGGKEREGGYGEEGRRRGGKFWSLGHNGNYREVKWEWGPWRHKWEVVENVVEVKNNNRTLIGVVTQVYTSYIDLINIDISLLYSGKNVLFFSCQLRAFWFGDKYRQLHLIGHNAQTYTIYLTLLGW